VDEIDQWIRKDFEMTWSWPNLRYYPRIFLEGLGKTTKSLTQDSQCSYPRFEPNASRMQVVNITDWAISLGDYNWNVSYLHKINARWRRISMKCCMESLCWEFRHEFNSCVCQFVVSCTLHGRFGFSDSFIVQEIGAWDKIVMLLGYALVGFLDALVLNEMQWETVSDSV
jgi:hypothetical protein